MLMFIVSVSVFWWIVSQRLGLASSFIFTLYILTERYWVDIWTRLGPGETYAVFGSTLFFLGFLSLLRERGRPKMDFYYYNKLLLVLLGTLVAIGSKENFLILVFPVIYLFIVKFRRKQLHPVFTAAVLLILVIFWERFGS